MERPTREEKGGDRWGRREGEKAQSGEQNTRWAHSLQQPKHKSIVKTKASWASDKAMFKTILRKTYGDIESKPLDFAIELVVAIPQKLLFSPVLDRTTRLHQLEQKQLEQA